MNRRIIFTFLALTVVFALTGSAKESLMDPTETNNKSSPTIAKLVAEGLPQFVETHETRLKNIAHELMLLAQEAGLSELNLQNALKRNKRSGNNTVHFSNLYKFVADYIGPPVSTCVDAVMQAGSSEEED